MKCSQVKTIITTLKCVIKQKMFAKQFQLYVRRILKACIFTPNWENFLSKIQLTGMGGRLTRGVIGFVDVELSVW